MNKDLVDWTFDVSRAPAIGRFALVMLAMSCDEDALSTDVFVSDVARSMGMSDRTVQRCLRELEKLGELGIETSPGDWRGGRPPRRYTFLLPYAEPRDALSRPPKRRPVPLRIQLAVYKRDDHSCRTCGSEDDLTIDHILAVANGGTEEIANLQVLCRSCNSSKGTKAA